MFSFLWFLGLVEMSMTPQKPLSLTWDPPNYSTEFEEKQKHFREILFVEISEAQTSKLLQKTRVGKSSRSVLSNLENLEYGINIFQKSWNEHLGFSIQLKESVPQQGVLVQGRESVCWGVGGPLSGRCKPTKRKMQTTRAEDSNIQAEDA